MVNLLQMNSHIIGISIALGIALIIATTAALNMIEKKRMNLFIPFFVFGIGTCLLAGFMFYDFFGVAVDVFYVFSFVVVVWIFFEIWRSEK